MSRKFWDAQAVAFDAEADHGLSDPQIRSAWRDLLAGALPPAPARVADLGCGTGTLAQLLADEGYQVDGLDFSPAMIERARAKVPGAAFVVGDAAAPTLEQDTYDVVLCRHVLWALPDPIDAFARWVRLLKTDGIVVLIEGRWHTGGGLTAEQTEQIVRSQRTNVRIERLSKSSYWGKDITDERYLLISDA